MDYRFRDSMPRLQTVGAAVAMIAIVGCADASSAPSAPVTPGAPAISGAPATLLPNSAIAAAAAAERDSATAGRTTRGFEDEILRLENVIPGLGGLFIDSTGRLTIYVPEPGDSVAIRATLARYAASLNSNPRWQARLANSGSVRLVAGQYPFSYLVVWMNAFSAHTGPGDGVWGIGANAALNRVQISVIAESVEPSALNTAASVGIPPDAIVFEVGPPPSF
jgi:hypothetical protein